MSSNGDLYEMYIESNRCTIINAIDPVRCYFDKMRELRVLTADDTEEIINKNPTRRFKAGHFLDILQTKGNNGVQCFLDTLELQNPETFQKVTNKKPRPPPPDFVKSRHSIDLDLLNRIPETIRTIHDQVKDNTDMNMKLQELEKGLQLNQKDKDELQVENDELRTENMSLKSQVIELGKKCGELVKQNVKLKDDSMEYLKNSLEFTKERDVYREKWSNAQMEKNELERKLSEKSEESSQDYQCQCQLDCSARAAPAQPDQDHKIRNLEKEIERLDIEKQILKEELDETRQNSEDIVNRMYISNSELNQTFKTCSELEKEVETLRKENKRALETCQERKEKVEKYFERIQELEHEKKQLEEERIKDQKRATEESSLRTKLFTENHELENKYEDLKIRYDLLLKRTSQKSRGHQQEHASRINGEETFCFEDNDYKSNTLPAHITGIPHNYHIPPPVGLPCGGNRLSHPVKRRPKKKGPTENFESVIPKDQSQRDSDMHVFVSSSLKNRVGERLHSDMYETEDLDPSVISCYVSNSIESEINSVDSSSTDRRDTVSEDSCDELELVQYDIIQEMIPNYPLFTVDCRTETFSVTLRMPVLGEQLEIMGGNFTGIFISKVLKKPADQCLKPGDQILSIVEICDNEDRETKSFMNCTAETASKLLDAENNPCKASSVELTCVRDKEAFQDVIRWMTETNSNGDFFYVRSNFTWRGCDDEYAVNSGDVFRVLDTSTRPRQWKVNCYDKVNQSWDKKTVYIPNRKEALRECIKGKIKKVDLDKLSISRVRTAGIRCRSEHYMNVLPVKATSKSPVLLFGCDEVVTRVQELLSNSQNTLHVDIVRDNILDMMKHFPQVKSDAHLLRKGSLTPLERNQSIRIILFLHLQNDATINELQKIFGANFDVPKERPREQVLEGHLQALGLHFDTVKIPNKQIYDQDSLLTFLIFKINFLQNRVYWLGTQNLTFADRDQYQFILEDRANQSIEEDKTSLTRSLSDNPPSL